MTGGTWWSGAGLAVLLVGACSGQSIEFEHTDGGAGRSPADSAGGTGGSQAGSTGGTSSGAGTPGRAGTGGTGAPDPELDTSCDYQTVIMADCAKGGCHKGSLAAAELDLSNTSGLVSKLKDVPARHLGIQCSAPTEPYMECIPASCPSALRIDSANWEQSWVISKLRGTQGGCGDVMPDPDYRTKSPQREACLEALVKAIAELPAP